MDIGRAINVCRLRKKLSLSELAEKSGCSASYLSLLENSKRDVKLSMIEKIAKALGVPVAILFFLGADPGELEGLDRGTAGEIAMTALELLGNGTEAKV